MYSLQTVGNNMSELLTSTGAAGPAGSSKDPVGKIRVSNPMNLIDTDFEYGLQSTKWETLELVNNIPTFFCRDGDFTLGLSSVYTYAGSSDINVVTAEPHGFMIGTAFIIVGLIEPNADGSYMVLAVQSPTSFVYKSKSVQTSTMNIYDRYSSFLYPARIFQGAEHNLDQLVKMETDGSQQSIITVQTKAPNNYLPTTRLLLANSVGQKDVDIDAAAVDPDDNLTSEFIVDLDAAISTGYSAKAVNPHDWQSQTTSFFGQTDVDLTTSTITINSTSLKANDVVMYTPPINDLPVGGLLPYRPYNVLSVDADKVQLGAIKTNYIHENVPYKVGWLLERSSPSTWTSSSYYVRNSSASSSTGAYTSYARTLTGITRTYTITDTNDLTYFNTNYGTSSDNRHMIAYFVAKDAGTYTFGITVNPVNTSSDLFAWINYASLDQTPNWYNDTSITGAEAPQIVTLNLEEGAIIPMLIAAYDTISISLAKIYYTIPNDATEYTTSTLNGHDYIRNNSYYGPNIMQDRSSMGSEINYPAAAALSIAFRSNYNNLATTARPYFYESLCSHQTEYYSTTRYYALESFMFGTFKANVAGTYQFRPKSSSGTVRLAIFHNSTYNSSSNWNSTSSLSVVSVSLYAGEEVNFLMCFTSNNTQNMTTVSFEYKTPIDSVWRSTAFAHNHVYIYKNWDKGAHMYRYNSNSSITSFSAFVEQSLNSSKQTSYINRYSNQSNQIINGIRIPHLYIYRGNYVRGTMLMYGHFHTKDAGVYTFSTSQTSYQTCYFAFGDAATNFVNNQYSYFRTSSGTASATFTLEADHLYPFAFMFSSSTSSVRTFGLGYTLPGSSVVIYSTSYNNHQYIISHQMNDTDPYTKSNTPITLTDAGTSNNGFHALHKAYLVSQVLTPGTNAELLTDANTTSYSGGLGVGDSIAFFSGDYNMRNALGIYAVRSSVDNVSKANYTLMYVKSNPVIGSSTTSVSVSRTSGGPIVRIDDAYVNTITWMIPVYSLATMDSIYYKGHKLPNNALVTFNMVSGTPPIGLTNGQNYKVSQLTSDIFRLKLVTDNSEVDIKSHGTGTARLVYNYANPFSNTIFAPNHGFVNSMLVRYDNNGNPDIGGLVNGSSYYIKNATFDRFRLSDSSLLSTTVDITSHSDGVHVFTAVKNATDGNYKVSNVVNRTTFTLEFPFKIPIKQYTFTPSNVLNLKTSTFIIPVHQQTTGARITYNAGSNTPIGGLQTEFDYYIIRTGLDTFRIASSYDDALADAFVSLTDLGTGTYHVLSFHSICGETETSDNVSTEAGSNVITAPTEDFLGSRRVGDYITVQFSAAQSTLNVTSVDTTTDVIKFSVAHGLADGDPVRYYTKTSGLIIPGLEDNSIYYVTISGLLATEVTLYRTPSDQQTSQNRVNITATSNATYGRFVTLREDTVFKSKINEIKSPRIVHTENNAPITTTAGRYLNITMLLPRNDGSVLHRPYDGGVIIIPSNNPNASIIRQTRKYFRYQSGKSIQISKAVNFSAPTNLSKIYKVDGATIMCNTRYPHRITSGLRITIEGTYTSEPELWNTSHTISEVIDDKSFTIVLDREPLDFSAGGFPAFYVNNWTNSALRVGLFDDQNGMFYEYDGTRLYAVRRSSTLQLQGTSIVEFGSSLVSGEYTNFTSQLSEGDYVVIKGQTYKVCSIMSATEMYIIPAYRGINNTNVTITKTVDFKVPSSEFNYDKFDGTGPSKYMVDIHKIQMIYIDYSWYGAGMIRFGLKTGDGEIIYGHTMIHNNILTESYMRSGNLPGRYEVTNTGIPTFVPALMHWGTSVIMDGRMDDDKAYWFTASGKTLVFNGPELILFTANTTSGGISSSMYLAPGTDTFAYAMSCSNFDAISGIKPGTLLSGINPTTGIAEGTITVGYPVRRRDGSGTLYINKPRFGNGSTNATVGAGEADNLPTIIPLVSIRLSPSVDNGRSGGLGSREIITRMQLVLKSVGILCTNDAEINIILNSFPYNKAWESVQYPSLSQLIIHDRHETIDGGTTIYSFRIQGGSVDSTGTKTVNSVVAELSDITDLGNSILGGDDTFPNGPDILTVAVKVLDFSGISAMSPLTVNGRISWTESQA